MGFTTNDDWVRGDLFMGNGKWKYTVALDYRDSNYESWDLWTEAERALERATNNGTSGVTYTKVPPGWMLVVLEPRARHSHPITVIRPRS